MHGRRGLGSERRRRGERGNDRARSGEWVGGNSVVGGSGLGWQKEDRGWKQRRVKGGESEERTVASSRAAPRRVASSAGFSRTFQTGFKPLHHSERRPSRGGVARGRYVGFDFPFGAKFSPTKNCHGGYPGREPASRYPRLSPDSIEMVVVNCDI